MDLPCLEIPPGAVCRGCGYDLTGLETSRCPECGREFDPARPATMRFPATERAAWRRWGGDLFLRELAKPTDRPTRAVPAFAAAVSLWGASMGRGAYVLWVGLFFWFCLVTGHGVVWVMRQIAYSLGGLTPEQARVDRRFEWRAIRWAAATAVLIALGVPVRVGFWISRPWLNGVVREARRSSPNDATPPARYWAGIYPIWHVGRDMHGVFVEPPGGGFFFKDVPGVCERFRGGKALGHDWYLVDQ